MHAGVLWLFVVVALASASTGGHEEHQLSEAEADADGSASPEVRAASGTFVGSWMRTRRGRAVAAYRGIKYALPPVGDLRFKPPQPILHYKEPVDARHDGAVCPQPAPRGTRVHEDCLVLNVYTPRDHGAEPLPVIVYIHAGGFYSMSSRSVVAGPDYLLDRDVVLVTLNYRLGSLGFLALGTAEAPGNLGYKDQVAALRWVQRNIRAFGGDPDRVTLTGCSAGSISVMLHMIMISPMSKGLFHRAISMSGSPTSKVPSPEHRLDLADKQARFSACPTHSPAAIYSCLRTKTWREIAGSMLGFYEFGFDPLALWRPVVERDFGQERFLTEEPLDAIRAGRVHAVPYIISQTRDEFFWKAFYILNNASLTRTMDEEWERVAPISFILPRQNASEPARRLRAAYLPPGALADDSATADGLGKLYGDAITAFPVYRLANLMCRHSPQPVWLYLLDYAGERSFYLDPDTRRPVGVSHHDDLVYLFGMPLRFAPLAADHSADSRMVDVFTAIWYNFARYGDPNPRGDTPELSGVRWPRLDPDHKQFLNISRNFSIGHNLFEERFKLWDELYPIQY